MPRIKGSKKDIITLVEELASSNKNIDGLIQTVGDLVKTIITRRQKYRKRAEEESVGKSDYEKYEQKKLERSLKKLKEQENYLSFEAKNLNVRDRISEKENKSIIERKKVLENSLEYLKELSKSKEEKEKRDPLALTKITKKAEEEGAFITAWLAKRWAKQEGETIEKIQAEIDEIDKKQLDAIEKQKEKLESALKKLKPATPQKLEEAAEKPVKIEKLEKKSPEIKEILKISEKEKREESETKKKAAEKVLDISREKEQKEITLPDTYDVNVKSFTPEALKDLNKSLSEVISKGETAGKSDEGPSLLPSFKPRLPGGAGGGGGGISIGGLGLGSLAAGITGAVASFASVFASLNKSQEDYDKRREEEKQKNLEIDKAQTQKEDKLVRTKVGAQATQAIVSYGEMAKTPEYAEQSAKQEGISDKERKAWIEIANERRKLSLTPSQQASPQASAVETTSNPDKQEQPVVPVKPEHSQSTTKALQKITTTANKTFNNFGSKVDKFGVTTEAFDDSLDREESLFDNFKRYLGIGGGGGGTTPPPGTRPTPIGTKPPAGITETTDISKISPEQKKNLERLAKAGKDQGLTEEQIKALQAISYGESRLIPQTEQSYAGTSNERIREVFKNNSRIQRLSEEELTGLKQNPEKFYNTVYGNRASSLGNETEEEGYKYRGRGFIQLTGKANYAKYGKELGIDLLTNPDLANDPEIAAKIAARYAKTRSNTQLSGQDYFENLSKSVAGTAVENQVATNAAIKQSVFNQLTGKDRPPITAAKSSTQQPVASAAPTTSQPPPVVVNRTTEGTSITPVTSSQEKTKLTTPSEETPTPKPSAPVMVTETPNVTPNYGTIAEQETKVQVPPPPIIINNTTNSTNGGGGSKSRPYESGKDQVGSPYNPINPMRFRSGLDSLIIPT